MLRVSLFLAVVAILGASAEDTETAHVWWANGTTKTGDHKTTSIKVSIKSDVYPSSGHQSPKCCHNFG